MIESPLATRLFSRTLPALICLSVLAGLTPPVEGQLTVSVTGEEDGGSASVLWVRKPMLGFGLTHHQYRGAQWTYGTVSYGRRLLRWIGQAEANLGAGEANGAFSYAVIRLNVIREIVPGRFYVELEDRYLDIDRLQGNLVRGGVQWVPADQWMVSSSALASTGGNLGMRYLTARIDRRSVPIGFLGGVTAGRSEPGFFRELSEAPPGSSREIFAGMTFQASAGRAMIILSSARTGDDERVRASVSWTFAD